MIDIGSGELRKCGDDLDDCTGSGRSELLLPYKRFTRHKTRWGIVVPLPLFSSIYCWTRIEAHRAANLLEASGLVDQRRDANLSEGVQ